MQLGTQQLPSDWSPYGEVPSPASHPAPTANPHLIWWRGRYQLYRNLWRGEVHRPPPGTFHPFTDEGITTYLLQNPKEPDSDFAIRAAQAFELNFPKEVIRLITGTIFRQPAVRDPAAQALGPKHFSDLDLRGTPAREFARRAFTKALIYGWVATITDSPRLGQQLLTQADEQVAELRPWSTVIDPLHVWDWRIDPVTGRFRYVLLWLGGTRWKAWYPDGWAVLREDGSVESAGSHELGGVPLDVLAPDPVDDDGDLLAPLGISALAGIAGLALHVYQMGSLLEEHEREALFSVLHIEHDPPTAKASEKATAPDLQLSSAHYLWTRGAVEWVTPPATVPQEARAQITWAVTEMRQIAGVATRTEESVEAHAAAALVWESADKHSMIRDLGQAAEIWETALYRRHGRILGRVVPPDCVRYPTDYVLETVAEEIGELERQVALFGGWERVPAWALPYLIAKYRRLVVKDVEYLPDLPRLLAPIDDAIQAALAPPEPPPAPVPVPVPVPEALSQPSMAKPVPPGLPQSKIVVGGRDDGLYQLLISYYAPLLAADFLDASAQFLILSDGRAAGVISFMKGDYCQVALAPQYTGRGLAEQALRALVPAIYPAEKVRWTTRRDNLPSLELLRRLGGGIFVGDVEEEKDDSLEGVWTPGKPIPAEMIGALEQAISEAQAPYAALVKRIEARSAIARRIEAHITRSGVRQ